MQEAQGRRTPQAEYFYGTGRRKEAVARVRIYPGVGEFIVNGRSSRDYFGGRDLYQITIMQPLRLTNTGERFNVSVRVVGGGVSGQAGAIRHGLARALTRFDAEPRPSADVFPTGPRLGRPSAWPSSRGWRLRRRSSRRP